MEGAKEIKSNKYLNRLKKLKPEYIKEDLNVIAYANGFTLWSYVSDDTTDMICSKDYFSKADQDLKAGDMILFSSRNAVIAIGSLFVVSIVRKGFVNINKLCSSV